MALFDVKQGSIALTFLIFALYFSASQSKVLLPRPSGRYDVGLKTARLLDKSRLDPFAPFRRPRALMVSFFYPAGKDSGCCLAEYMPFSTAVFEDRHFAPIGVPNGTFEKLSLQVSCRNSSSDTYKHHHHRDREWPVILFSPGLGTPRLLYSAIAQSIASAGYFVVTIDHPYDADVVEFPDGELVFAPNISTDADIELAVRTRAQDASFVIDELKERSAARDFFPGASCAPDTDKVAMFGHSLGGAATAAAMLNDTRILGGANLDGTFFGPVVEQGLDRPFLIFGNQDHNRSTDESWAAIWPRLRGWKVELQLRESQHLTFSDGPLLVKVLGLGGRLSKEAESLLGTLDGGRALEIVRTYGIAFFDFVLRGVEGRLLRGADERFPEVVFVD